MHTLHISFSQEKKVAYSIAIFLKISDCWWKHHMEIAPSFYILVFAVVYEYYHSLYII